MLVLGFQDVYLANIRHPKERIMNAQEIMQQLNRNGFNQTAIANVLECSSSLISKVINRKATSVRIAEAISKLLELTILDVFPEYEILLCRKKHCKKDAEKLIRDILQQDIDTEEQR